MKKQNKKIDKKKQKNTSKKLITVKLKPSSFERAKNQSFFTPHVRVSWIDQDFYEPDPNYDY
jgi:hypothetical protein